jgi:hypothetical protein
MVEWFERYEWSTSPFEINHVPNTISGFDDIRKSLLSYIKSGDFCLLQGELGSGKTLILKWIEEIGSLGYIYIYFSPLGSSDIDLEKLIKEKEGFLGRISLKKKRFVLLIDDSYALSQKSCETVKGGFDNKLISSVLIAADSSKVSDLNETLLGEVGERMVSMRPMTSEEAMGMILNRVMHKNPFEKNSLELVFKGADYLPKRILELCEEIAKSNTESIITRDFVTRFIEEKERGKPKNVLELLSPLQKDIVRVLKTGDSRPVDIARILNKPTKTITSQLSYLGLKAGIETMKRKGLEQPLVEKISERPTKYRLRELNQATG